MAFDGLITKSVVSELNSAIVGGKINKVFQPNNNELLVNIYSYGTNFSLDICTDAHNCRLHLTNFSKPNPLNAPNFCMLLRKHLIGSKIKTVSSYDLERVVVFELETYNELNDLVIKKLIVELMGKHSNVILINENNKIIDSLRHLDISSNSLRNISPSFEYIFPSSNKISLLNTVSFSCFKDIVLKDLNTSSIDMVLSDKFIGISRNFIQYIINKLNLDFSLPNNISSLEILYNYLQNIINNIGSDNLFCINTTLSNNKTDYVLDFVTKPDLLSINLFLDDFYHQKEESDTFINYKNSLLRLILNNLKKYNKKLHSINSKIKECSNMDTYKLYGELITANLYKLSAENQASICLENYYDNNNIISIPLDASKTPSYNAKQYFKKYNKLKCTLKFVEDQKKETLNELNYIESIIYELENTKSISEIDDIYQEISDTILSKDRSYSAKKVNVKKKLNKKKVKDTTWVPIEYTVDGFSVFVGKNNKQNDYLTCKLAKPHDIWFHTKDIHGSHVILRTQNQEIPSQILVKCASIAAFYSKAKNSSNVPVDYTFVKNVKKPNGAKPGMVIYTNNNTINVNPKDIND